MPIPGDPIHRAAREQQLLLAEQFLDDLLVGFAGAIQAFSARMRGELGMGARPDPEDEKPAKAKKPPKPPPVDARGLEDDDGRGEYDPSAGRSSTRRAKPKPKAEEEETQEEPEEEEEEEEEEGEEVEPAAPERPGSIERALLDAESGRYRTVVGDAIAAAKGGQKAEDVPYDTPSAYRTKWLNAFHAMKGVLSKVGR